LESRLLSTSNLTFATVTSKFDEYLGSLAHSTPLPPSIPPVSVEPVPLIADLATQRPNNINASSIHSPSPQPQIADFENPPSLFNKQAASVPHVAEEAEIPIFDIYVQPYRSQSISVESPMLSSAIDKSSTVLHFFDDYARKSSTLPTLLTILTYILPFSGNQMLVVRKDWDEKQWNTFKARLKGFADREGMSSEVYMYAGDLTAQESREGNLLVYDFMIILSVALANKFCKPSLFRRISHYSQDTRKSRRNNRSPTSPSRIEQMFLKVLLRYES
jgi:hypothetical protein